MQGEIEGIARAVIEAALSGDLVAARLVLDRVAPAPRDRTVKLALPDVTGAADLPIAMAALLREVCSGHITSSEAESLTRLLESYRHAIECAEFSDRLTLLEERIGRRRRG